MISFVMSHVCGSNFVSPFSTFYLSLKKKVIIIRVSSQNKKQFHKSTTITTSVMHQL